MLQKVNLGNNGHPISAKSVIRSRIWKKELRLICSRQFLGLWSKDLVIWFCTFSIRTETWFYFTESHLLSHRLVGNNLRWPNYCWLGSLMLSMLGKFPADYIGIFFPENRLTFHVDWLHSAGKEMQKYYQTNFKSFQVKTYSETCLDTTKSIHHIRRH